MSREKIAVVGAGLVGSLQAIYLANKGYEVHVFERRGDIRAIELVAGRSINLALSNRGWKALEGVGMGERIREISIPMPGRMMHSTSGDLTFQAYGKDSEAIYSVPRGELNQILLQKADENDQVFLHFDMKCRDIDLKTNTIQFQNAITKEPSQEQFDRIFGTDGAFSAVRLRLQKTDRFNFSQTYLSHGYKELVIPPTADGKHRFDKNALHIWPRGEFMLIALPNQDGSFTVTLFFPFEGKTSFKSLDSDEKIMAFFKETFPDALDQMPNLIEDYHDNPTSSLVTVRCSPWNYKDKICLMGDASHAVVPFYGQGMNSGFEDCTIFNEILEQSDQEFAKAIPAFSDKRIPEANAIAELALRNYIEMRDKTGNPRFLLQKKIEARFSKLHPDKWLPLYSQVTFSHTPYDVALENGEIQHQIMQKVMDRSDIAEVWDSKEIEEAILAQLQS